MNAGLRLLFAVTGRVGNFLIGSRCSHAGHFPVQDSGFSGSLPAIVSVQFAVHRKTLARLVCSGINRYFSPILTILPSAIMEHQNRKLFFDIYYLKTKP